MSAPIASPTRSPGAGDEPFMFRWLAQHAHARPGSPLVVTPSMRLTYGEAHRNMIELAAQMAATGVGDGTRVLVALPNGAAAVVASLAVQRLGGIAIEVDRSSSPDTLGAIASRSAVRQLVIWHRDLPRWTVALAGHPPAHVWVVRSDDPALARAALPATWSVSAIAPDGSPDDTPAGVDGLPQASPDPEAPTLVLYTSGSTGTPQGVIQTHRNIAANTRSIVSYLGLAAEDRVLSTLPLYYCYGRSLLQTHLFVGGSVYFDDRFAFPRVVMEALADQGCTGFAGVPLTFEILRRKVNLASLSMPTLRYVTQAGGAMAPDTTAWARASFAPARLFVMYGQTEATARLSYLPPEHAATKEGSIGVPVPGVELRVVDPRGVQVPQGTVGELIARGENVTPGYLDDPATTAQIVRDGWLWTGDLAIQDGDGFLFHRGRAKEILKVGGHRVSPVDIEQAIERHPRVSEAGVCGTPDPLVGEVPVAFVVPTDGSPLGAAELRAFARAALAPHMVPTEFHLVQALPRNEAGKLRRSELMALLSVSTPSR